MEFPEICAAAYQGRGDVVMECLEDGDDIETLGGSEVQWTPLIWAIDGGHNDTAMMLIRDYHANVNFRSKPFGDTPLLKALEWGNSFMVECLILGGADLKSLNNWKETPLDTAIRRRAQLWDSETINTQLVVEVNEAIRVLEKGIKRTENDSQLYFDSRSAKLSNEEIYEQIDQARMKAILYKVFK
jgi:ankyrin repeat protein